MKLLKPIILCKALFIPALLASGVFNTCAAAEQTPDNIAYDYVAHWNEVMIGQTTPISQATALDSEIIKNCKTIAPKQFRGEMLHQWERKTGTKMTETAFLSEDLQMFDRLATISCIEGADYERKGTGDILVKALNAQLLDMDVKDGDDAFEQIKTMEFRAGIMTARYGISIEKQRSNLVN